MCEVQRKPRPADPAVVEALMHFRVLYDRAHANELRNSEAGHWINEAFIVRLWAVLQAHGITGAGKSVDVALDGGPEVRVCKLLRNNLAHATGVIKDKDTRYIDRELRRVFKLGTDASLISDRFILAKDRVLRPMHTAALRYASAVLVKESSELNAAEPEA